MAKRTVEVFTAGCGLCSDTLARVRQLACENCDVQVHDLTSEAGMAKAREYGVTRAPSVVVKPKLGDCCVFCSYGTVPCPPRHPAHRSWRMALALGLAPQAFHPFLPDDGRHRERGHGIGPPPPERSIESHACHRDHRQIRAE